MLQLEDALPKGLTVRREWTSICRRRRLILFTNLKKKTGFLPVAVIMNTLSVRRPRTADKHPNSHPSCGVLLGVFLPRRRSLGGVVAAACDSDLRSELL